MPTIQESVDALVVETTGLTNTVSGRITDMTNKVAAADVAKGAAENAKSGAEIARSGAETAKTASETAQTLAETAKTNAETASTSAAGSSSSAGTSETNASSSATAAGVSETNASSSASSALASKNTAETKATQSAVSAAASASSAVDATNNGTTAANAVVGNMYTKAETDVKIVELSPPTDISGKFNKTGGTISGQTTITAGGNDGALYVNGGLQLDDGPGSAWHLGKGLNGASGSEFKLNYGTTTAIQVASDSSVRLGKTTTDDTIQTKAYASANKKSLVIGRPALANRMELTYDSQGTENAYVSRYYNASVLHFDMNGVDHMSISNVGDVYVKGSIKIGDDTRTAATAGAGTLRFNTGKLQASDGGTWEDVNYNGLSDNPCSVLGFPITGDVCGTVINTAGSVGGCSEGDYTWAQFKGFCENIGARLCTRDEIKAGEIAGTGCSHDSRGVWSSTPGDTAGTYWVVNGSWEASQREQELNATSSTGLTGFVINQFGLRCCGDNY